MPLSQNGGYDPRLVTELVRGKKTNAFQKPPLDGVVKCKLLPYANVINIEQFVIPALQEKRCDKTMAYIQDGAPPHNADCEKQVLRCHFSKDRIPSRHFPTYWPPRPPD
ncbi:hypothetical protein TNCV_3049341 [Trichonephila clavipes]|nr:hypothetical protein TNCV_3049341 [Trichonephila clavipes]